MSKGEKMHMYIYRKGEIMHMYMYHKVPYFLEAKNFVVIHMHLQFKH